MPESLSTSIAKAVERTLTSIQLDQGYVTDAGANVYRGWYAHAMHGRGMNFPIIAIQPDTEGVQKVSGTGCEFKIATNLRIVVVADDTSQPSDVLRDCLADIRRALALQWELETSSLPGVRAPDIGLAEFAIAADSPYTLAALPVGINFTEKHEA
jgi:hypothetical protein